MFVSLLLSCNIYSMENSSAYAWSESQTVRVSSADTL